MLVYLYSELDVHSICKLVEQSLAKSSDVAGIFEECRFQNGMPVYSPLRVRVHFNLHTQV